MTAKEGIKYLLEKCDMEEPVFILRGRDTLAPLAVLRWSELAEQKGVSEEKVCSAIAVSHEMRKWPANRLPD
jgi:hypothetical protein